MTLFIIGFSLLLGLIITLEVKSRKREKGNDQKYFDITKKALGNQLVKFKEQIENSQDCLEDQIYRKFAMLYAKGIDSIAPIHLKKAKEKGYFDRNFFFEGEEYEFHGFDVIKGNEITIIASPIVPSMKIFFKRITIFKDGLFTALDFTEDSQAPQKIDIVEEPIDSNLIEKRLIKIIEDLNKTLNRVPSEHFDGSLKAAKALKELVIDIKKNIHTN